MLTRQKKCKGTTLECDTCTHSRSYNHPVKNQSKRRHWKKSATFPSHTQNKELPTSVVERLSAQGRVVKIKCLSQFLYMGLDSTQVSLSWVEAKKRRRRTTHKNTFECNCFSRLNYAARGKKFPRGALVPTFGYFARELNDRGWRATTNRKRPNGKQN